MLSPPKDMILVSPKEDIPSSTIHMAFMRYPLDVVWADDALRVIDVQKNIPALNPLKPGTWKTYKPKKAAKYVIELGSGKVGTTEEGDQLELA